MILFRIKAAFLLLPGLCCSGMMWSQTTPRWVTTSSYDGRFQISAPGQLAEKIDSIETPVGKLVYRVHFYQPQDKTAENLIYMVSWCDYPEGSIHSDSTELLKEFFEATMESAAFSIQGSVVYSDEYKMDKYPGKIWRIDYLDGQAIVKTRAFVVRNRYYALQTISRKERHLNTSGEKFFDSFRLAGK